MSARMHTLALLCCAIPLWGKISVARFPVIRFSTSGPRRRPSAATVTATSVTFEKDPQPFHNGKPSKSPKFISRRAQGVLGIYTAPAERGADLFYVSSSDVGETWTEPQRVNHIPGEVSDHGENSPQFFLSPDEMTIYAFWNARDAKGGSHVRFSRGGAMMTTWSPAVTIDDDPAPNSHGFPGRGGGARWHAVRSLARRARSGCRQDR